MTWPNSTLESIYVLYPNKQDKKTTLKRIGEALDRICEGEIDAKPRTQPEAVEFLRKRTEEARRAFAGRDKHFVPHSTTFYNKKKYLQSKAEQIKVPENLDECIEILSQYPTAAKASVIKTNLHAFLPGIEAVHQVLKVASYSQLLSRVKLYSECVEGWSKDDRRYIPNAVRWFSEHRFNQDEALWRRSSSSFADERSQLRRILDA